MPKVTVVTPNYNYARYLPQRLDSILAQTYQDFELIILDDASTDNSREVIESYAKDPRIRTIYNGENSGSTFKQWNLGLKHARGRYIWFAEADDYAKPSLIETLAKMLSISDIALVTSPLNHFRHYPATARNRVSREIVAIPEMERVQRLLVNRCGLLARILEDKQLFSALVDESILTERRPPYNEVPPVRTLGLLLWFARLHPRAFKMALPILSWELMADVARRVGKVGLARELQNGLAARGHESGQDDRLSADQHTHGMPPRPEKTGIADPDHPG
jgi:glycosyltransferase involved in cell wall biosynthesis